MPDIRDVKVGDEIEITAKFKVAKISTAGTVYSYNSSAMSDEISIGIDTPTDLYTLKIIPKPLAVGDAVRFGDKLIGTIVALADNVAWVKRTSGDHTTYYLKDLKKDNCNCD